MILLRLVSEATEVASRANRLNHCRFVNQEGLDFSTAQDVAPTQEFDLNEDFRGILEYPVKCDPFTIQTCTCSSNK